PFAHQLLELGVSALGQHDAHADEEIAGAALCRETLALETEGAARIGGRGNRELDRAVEGGDAHFAAEHRLVKADRKLEPEIRAVAGKERMRRDLDRDQNIAVVAAGAGEPLPLEPNGLAVVEPGRDLDLDLLPGREHDPFLAALRRLRQRDGQRHRNVLAGASEFLLLELEATAAAARRPGHAAERLLQDILEAAKASAGAEAATLEAARSPGEGLETATTGTRAEAFEALEARLALRVDLAAVESPALALLPQNLIGSVELGKTRGRLRVMLVGVRVELLGLPPERALDVRRARGLRYPQDVIGVAHRHTLRGGSVLRHAGQSPRPPSSNVGSGGAARNGKRRQPQRLRQRQGQSAL